MKNILKKRKIKKIKLIYILTALSKHSFNYLYIICNECNLSQSFVIGTHCSISEL